MSYFRKLPLDDLKIDQSFCDGHGTNHEDATIVRSTIEMGHELGLRVVAEGVEDIQTWEKLTELGCDSAQGYLHGATPPHRICLKALRIALGLSKCGCAGHT